MTIRVLSSDLSSQISAGEVIDRPSSVVKEIIENSIDANSKNIIVEIEKNGFKSIVLKDDGFGIDRHELLLAITRHATSKINSFSDLEKINTFGFRGEALASIRAVSRFTLISSNRVNNIAWKIYSEGFVDDDKMVLQPIAHPKGTTVIVENLFYNIPIKLKFIKNKKFEFLKICEIFKKIALSHFYINFSLIHNKKIVVQYNALKKLSDKINRLKDVFLDKINLSNILEINAKAYNIVLFGWISYPQCSNFFNKIQYCYVNNRYIHNNLIMNAIRSAYNEMAGNKNISFILYLTIPPHEIDVNIHPTKNEIIFNHSDIVYSFIYDTILRTLKKNKDKYLFQVKTLPYFKKNIIKDKNIIKKIDQKFLFNKYVKKKHSSFPSLLIIFRQYYGLLYQYDDFSLISLPLAEAIVKKYQLRINLKEKITPKCCLTNIQVNISVEEYIILLNNQKILLLFGFHFVFKKNYITLKSIPVFFKKRNTDFMISNFFRFLVLKKRVLISDIVDWLYMNVFIELKHWNYIDGTSVLVKIQYYCPFLFENPPPNLLQKININSALYMLKI